jgi:hypothetical protein
MPQQTRPVTITAAEIGATSGEAFPNTREIPVPGNECAQT